MENDAMHRGKGEGDFPPFLRILLRVRVHAATACVLHADSSMQSVSLSTVWHGALRQHVGVACVL